LPSVWLGLRLTAVTMARIVLLPLGTGLGKWLFPAAPPTYI